MPKTSGPVLSAAVVLTVLSVLWPAAAAEPPGFAQSPTVKSGPEGASVRFALNRPTDVEVAVVDAEGKVVRHLAAGLLGPKAPPPLKSDSLAQELLWDGKDDAGAAVAGPVKFRVRLGLRPVFGHFIGQAPGQQNLPLGMQCDPKGNLYVLSALAGPHGHWTTSQMKVFDRQGNYLRQVMPYPPGLPAEKRKAGRWIDLKDAPAVPLVHLQDKAWWLYPFRGIQSRVSVLLRPDGKIVLGLPSTDRAASVGRPYVIGPEGGVEDDCVGPAITSPGANTRILIALSPDGKTIYATEFFDLNRKGAEFAGRQVVYRTDWQARGRPEVFAGQEGRPGSGPGQLASPRGLATDAKGNVYVCDHGNNRVCVFSPKGEPLGQLPVAGAYDVAVHPKTGAVYVLSMSLGKTQWSETRKITKFDGNNSPRPAAVLDLGETGRPKACDTTVFCLDSSGDVPVLWVAPDFTPSSNWMTPRPRILKVLDKGDELARAGYPITDKTPIQAMYTLLIDLAVDRQREKVYGGGFEPSTWSQRYFWRPRYDGLTGRLEGELKFGPGGWGGNEGVWGRDGLLYLADPQDRIYRFDREGKPAPWKATGSHELVCFPQGFYRIRGYDVTADGDLYVLHHSEHRKAEECFVSRVGPDGKTVRKGLIRITGPSVGGLQVDRRGNIYVGVAAKPRNQPVPDWFAAEPAAAAAYTNMYGYLMKFPPAGGGVEADAQGDMTFGWHRNPPQRKHAAAKGLLWRHYGMFEPYRGAGCACQTPRFALDDYGRVFLPDVFRFRVTVLDAGGNEITRFGGYGNQDSRGSAGGAAGPGPEIPFAWPVAVYVTDRMAYVADTINHRAVAVRLQAQAEAFCSVEN